MRCAQFIRMFQSNDMNPVRAPARAATVSAQLATAGFAAELTPLGKKLFGLGEYGGRGRGRGKKQGKRGARNKRI